MSRPFVRLLGGSVTGLLLVMGLAMPAQGAPGSYIHNQFQCDRFNKCRQINGAYVASVPTVCSYYPSVILNPNRNIRLCDRWG